jgi:hypothetical protein
MSKLTMAPSDAAASWVVDVFTPEAGRSRNFFQAGGLAAAWLMLI